jgi:hypothetical protein
MAITFTGFGTNEAVARGILLDAVSVIDKAQDALKAKEWFGALGDADKATLKSGLHQMGRQFSRASFEVIYGTACAAGENANTEHFTGTSPSDVASKTSADIRSAQTLTASGKLRLTLCAKLFEKGYPRTAKKKQCQVQVVLHEMSHIGAGTIDVVDNRAGKPAGAKLYELDGATHAKTSGTAIQNAENWAFFLMDFYKLITPH